MSPSFVQEKPLDFLVRFQSLDDLQLETKDTLRTYNICSHQNLQRNLKILGIISMFVGQRLFIPPHPTSKVCFLGTQQKGRSNNKKVKTKNIWLIDFRGIGLVKAISL